MSKLRRLCLLTLVAVSSAACEQEEVTPPGQLDGPTVLAQAGRSLLVGSRAEDELRVLSLAGEQRTFVRAPNPIFPLAIPTAPLPQALGTWTSADGQNTAPFAVALSTVASLATVIATDSLTALGNFAVPDTSLSVALTAPVDGAPIRAVISAVQGEQGNLYVAQLPRELAQNPAGLADVAPQLALSLGRSTPQTVVASPVNPDLVLVGDRETGDDGQGRAGGLALVDLAAGTVERFDVGGPVASISFDGDGARAYGVIDSDACADGEPCSGVFGFDIAARALLPAAGAAPVEIPGVPRGVASGGAQTLTLPDGAQIGVTPLLLVSSTDGRLYFVDGGAMRLIDLNAASATLVERFHLEPDGTRTENVAGPDQVELAEGAVRTEQISVTYEGILPSLRSRSGAVAGTALTDAVDFTALGVQVGDLVIFEDAPENCATRETTISAVAQGQLDLAAFDPSCVPSPTTYSVRVAGAYAVTGTVTGLLGRVAANSTFEYRGAYFHRPDGFDPNRPALTFAMGAGDPRRDTRYVLVVDSGIRPFAVTQNAFSMPGPITFDPALGRFYAAFLGRNGVIEIQPGEVRDQDTSSGLNYFN